MLLNILLSDLTGFVFKGLVSPQGCRVLWYRCKARALLIQDQSQSVCHCFSIFQNIPNADITNKNVLNTSNKYISDKSQSTNLSQLLSFITCTSNELYTHTLYSCECDNGSSPNFNKTCHYKQ